MENRKNTENSSESGRKLWKKVWRILFVSASLALLLWLLDRVGWGKIAEYATRLGFSGMVVVLGLGVFHSILGGLALKKSLLEDVSLLYVHVANQAGAIVNRVIPWEAGEVVKVTLLNQRISSKTSISGIIIWNYLLKLTKPIATLCSATIAWIFGSSQMSDLALWMILASILAFTPYLIFKVLVHIGLANIAARVLRLVRIVRRDPDRVVAKAREIDNVVRTFSKTNTSAYFQIILLQFASYILSWIIVYAVLVFIGYDYDFATTGMIWTGFALMAYLVGLLPSRIGTTEASGWFLFKLLGLDPAAGLMVQCILTMRTIIVSGATSQLIHFFPSQKK